MVSQFNKYWLHSKTTRKWRG